LKGGEAIAKILRLEGVEWISVFPPTPITNPCSDAGIRMIMTRHERSAIAIADAFTRMSMGRRNGVATVMQDAGIENCMGGLSQAFDDLVPILLIPGGVNRSELDKRKFDPVKAYWYVTKWVARIHTAERIPEMMRRAFTYLRTGRPSPVMLEFPSELENAEFDDSKFVYKPVPGWRSAANPRDVEVAVRALLAAKAPLIFVGEGVFYADACNELKEFVELVQVPVVTTMKGKSAFPENHPLSAGFIVGRPPSRLIQKADLIFAIGSSLTPGFPGMSIPIPPGKKIIQCTIDEVDINREHLVDHVVLGDAKLVLRQLMDEVRRQTGGEGRRINESLIEEIKKLREEWIREWMQYLTSNEVPINPYRVIWDLMHTVDRTKTTITHDSGNPRDQLCAFWEAIIPRGYLGWGHTSTLGFSIPAVMGAKLACPDRLCIAFMGDAAVGQQIPDVETSVREKIPVLFVVLNNGGFGGYEKHHPSTSKVSPPTIQNYAKVGEGFGAYAERVEKPDDIIPAIKRGIKSVEAGRSALIEVISAIFPKYPFFVYAP
jgi:acetolactate synthase-1/2/3 large subunit